jgi:hypothetical protein
MNRFLRWYLEGKLWKLPLLGQGMLA